MSQTPPEPAVSPRSTEYFRDSYRRGAMAAVRISVFPFVFGVLFMTAALSRGFSGEQGVVMSVIVFAGSVLFAGMEIWNEPLHYLALAVTALSVGSRHVLMGLTLPGVFGRSVSRPPLLTLFFLTDLNWLLTTKAEDARNRFGYFLGCSTVVYSSWVLGTVMGWGMASLIDDVTLHATRSMGAIFMALLIIMLSRGFRGSRWPWLLAGVASALTSLYSQKLAILAGVLVGALFAGLTTGENDAQ